MSDPITYASDGFTVVFYPLTATAIQVPSTQIATSTVSAPPDPSQTKSTSNTYAKLVTTTDSEGSTYTYTATTATRTRTSLVANEHVASTDADPGGSLTTGWVFTTDKAGNETQVWTTYYVNTASAVGYSGTSTSTVTSSRSGSTHHSTVTGTSSASPVGDADGKVNGTVTLGNVDDPPGPALNKAAKITIAVCSATFFISLAALIWWVRRRLRARRARARSVLEEKSHTREFHDEKPPGGGRLRITTDVPRGITGSRNRGIFFAQRAGDSVEELRDPFAESPDGSGPMSGDTEENMAPVSARGSVRNNGSLPPTRSGTANSTFEGGTYNSVGTVVSPAGMISPFPVPVTIGGSRSGALLPPPLPLRRARRTSEGTLNTQTDSMTLSFDDDDVYAVDGSSLARTLTTESLGSRDSRSTIEGRQEAAWGPFADRHAAPGRMSVNSVGVRPRLGSGSVRVDSEVDDDESIMARSGDAHVQHGWAMFGDRGEELGVPSLSGSTSTPSGGDTALLRTLSNSTILTAPSYTSRESPRASGSRSYSLRPAEPQFSTSSDPFADSTTAYSTLPLPGRPHSISGRSDRSASTNARTEASFRPGDDSREGALPLHSRWGAPVSTVVPSTELPARPARVTYRWREMERVETRSSLASDDTADTADTELRSREMFVRHGDATMGGGRVGEFGHQEGGSATLLGHASGSGSSREHGQGSGGKSRVVHLPPTYREVYGDDY